MSRDKTGQGRHSKEVKAAQQPADDSAFNKYRASHSHDESFAPVYVPPGHSSPEKAPEVEISDVISSFRAEVKGLILEGKLDKIPVLVTDHSQLTKQDYGDYVITRAELAKKELDNARDRFYRTGFLPWNQTEMTAMQKTLTQMIRGYSAPASNHTQNGGVQQKPDCYKTTHGY